MRRTTRKSVAICGCPRSGTTGLELLLNTSPSICILHESTLFAGSYDRAASYIRRNCNNDIMRNILESKRINMDELEKSLKKYKCFGDKFPDYVLPWFHDSLISKCDIILFTVRDVRDFICSSKDRYHYSISAGEKRQDWMTDNAFEACRIWCERNTFMISLMDKAKNEGVSTELIRFEDYAEKPRQLLKVLSRMGLPVNKCSTDVYEPINLRRWTKEWGNKINDVLSDEAIQLMKTLGYGDIT